MTDRLHYRTQQQTLTLQGELNRETLLPLWQQRYLLLTDQINVVDVSQLKQVDSSGLALLVHFHEQQHVRGVALKISGISDELYTLIVLYNLLDILSLSAQHRPAMVTRL